MWKTVSRLFPQRESAYARESRLASSYRRVFQNGGASDDDRQIVLADLAYYSGFAMITAPEFSDSVLRQNEGKRELFARIKGFLTLASSDIDALENAARTEAAMRERNGQ